LAESAVPSDAELVALLARAPKGHPRLFADNSVFSRIELRTQTDLRLGELKSAILVQAESVISKRPVERKLDGLRLLEVSRTAKLRIIALAAAWRLTGETHYAKRAEVELLAICAFSDWHPAHFLDTAEMTLAAAVGYDWLFEVLSPNTRNVVRQAIIQKGLKPSFVGNASWWAGRISNWSQVCHAGMLAGALVVQEHEPKLALEVTRRALANLPRVMKGTYAPDGAYPEGPGYWSYGTSFNVVAIEALRSVLGRDFGLTQAHGFLSTADYYAHAHGPSGVSFNYADCRADKMAAWPAQIWFARELKADWPIPSAVEPAATESFLQDGLLALGLIWADPQEPGSSFPRPLDFFAGVGKPVAMFRTAWDEPLALYLGVCGGTPSSAHGHMDVGSFVFEAGGVRWAMDLGAENYGKLEAQGVGLWDNSTQGQRWSVYRHSNFSHNTLVIGGQLQQVKGMAKITDVRTGSASPGCSLDLSEIYAGQALKVQRQFELPARERLVVRDKITGLSRAGTVRWQLVTRAQVEIAPDGRSARLKQSGRFLQLSVDSPATARLVVADAKGPNSFDSANDAQVLAVEVKAEAGATIDYQVTLTPLTPLAL
jgi:hypothetical protein